MTESQRFSTREMVNIDAAAARLSIISNFRLARILTLCSSVMPQDSVEHMSRISGTIRATPSLPA